jgi:hypothetical protein
MPVKKTAPAPVKAAPKRKVPVKGEKLVCETCGLRIIVDKVSGVVAFEELICCGAPMKAKTKSAKKKDSVAEKAPAAKKTPTVKKAVAVAKTPTVAKTPAAKKAPIKKVPTTKK